MRKVISILSVFAFLTATNPAAAAWCHNPISYSGDGGGVSPCNVVPSSWDECGTFQGEAVYCYPTQGNVTKPAKNKKNSNTALIAMMGGVAFVTAMWFIFKTPASKNNPGSVQLAAF